MVPWTILELSGANLPANFLGDYAKRGITMSLTMIEQAKRQRRNINGVKKDVSRAQFKKYAGTIACIDRESPRLAALLVGKVLGVKCVAELGTHGENTDGSPEQLQLTIMVGDWAVTRDEANVETGWQLVWEEV